jgi:uncharacterized membrane protein YraQ (UPF0718 family)
MFKLKKYYLTTVLAGYLIWLLVLLESNTLRLYINPRLSFLTVLTILLLGAMLFNLLWKPGYHYSGHRGTEQHPSGHHDDGGQHHVNHHDCAEYGGPGQLDLCSCCSHERWEKSSLLLLIPLILALTVPPRTLSYHADLPDLASMLPQIVTVFLSIVIQALPFVLIGVFGSSAMHNLITTEMVEAKLARASKLPGLCLAIGAGFFFPVCDCGVIPVARRLLIKKVPPYMAVAFLITAPLVNPITIWATATAFGYNLYITVTRVGLAIVVGLLVGLMVGKFFPTVEQLFNQKTLSEMGTAAATLTADPKTSTHKKAIFSAIFTHADEEFLEVGKFLIGGALLAATIQATVFKSVLLGVAHYPGLTIIIMMVLAVSLSLCAEADAFVARSFVNHVPLGGIMGFMVFGQMLDLKNLALLLKNFKPRALLAIFGLGAFLVFGFCNLLNLGSLNMMIWGR